ncbi:MAG: SDR family NAD(P)-dependent oxidoreductase [Pseudomonadota bacterium]
MNVSQDLENTVAWITGAARGIGAATARALARRGAQVHLSDIRDCGPVVEEIRSNGGTATAHHLDVTDRSACQALVESITRDTALHIVVCNAGICPPRQAPDESGQWRQVMDVNLEGTRHCVDAAWDALVASGDGRLVLVSSMAFYQGGLIVGTEYSASKAALVGMTRHLARNGGPLGVRCNAVAPGIIDTDMTADFDKPDLERIPLRRLGSAEEVAEPIAFLCSPGAGYMTGTVLNVTGGMILAA